MVQVKFDLSQGNLLSNKSTRSEVWQFTQINIWRLPLFMLMKRVTWIDEFSLILHLFIDICCKTNTAISVSFNLFTAFT